ncbi:MAG: mechanosensitive ion channel family protein [Cyanobacteriota bacterium]
MLKDFNLWTVAQALGAVALAYGLLLSLEWCLNQVAEHSPRRFRLLIKESLPFWKALILFSTLGYILDLFLDLSPSNIFALTGTAAVALGFAFKDYISSIIAGITALFEAPYRVGDRVKLGEHYGEVVNYGLRSVKIKTPDDDIVTIPHNFLWSNAVANANDGALEAQVAVDFHFGHGVDLALVQRILYQAAYTSKYTQLKLPVRVVITEKPWGIIAKLRCYPLDARDEFVFKTDLLTRARQAFSRYDLPLPVLSPLLLRDP